MTDNCIRPEGCPNHSTGPCENGCQAAADELIRLTRELGLAGEFTLKEEEQLHESLGQLRRGEVEPALTDEEYLRSILKRAGVPYDIAESLRQQYAGALLAVAEHRIVAEWICCEPLEEGHELCAQGYATLRMFRALLVDDPDVFPPRSDLLDAIMAVRDRRMEQLEAGRATWKAKAEEMERDRDRLARILDSVRATAQAHLRGLDHSINPCASGVLADLELKGGAHRYLSTSCLHGKHDYCKGKTGAVGKKIPAQCKFCATPCVCSCHAEDT